MLQVNENAALKMVCAKLLFGGRERASARHAVIHTARKQMIKTAPNTHVLPGWRSTECTIWEFTIADNWCPRATQIVLEDRFPSAKRAMLLAFAPNAAQESEADRRKAG